MMPTTIVNANPWSTSPPKKNNASTVRSVSAPRDDRPAERLVHRRIDDVVHRVTPHRSQVFPDAIEDHDRVVGRVPAHRQNGSNDVQRQVILEKREERERDEQVVNRRDYRADAEAELEPERQIREDADERQDGRRQPFLLQLAADGGADDFGALPFEIPEVGLPEGVFDLGAVVLNADPDSAPTCGTRMSTIRLDGSS